MNWIFDALASRRAKKTRDAMKAERRLAGTKPPGADYYQRLHDLSPDYQTNNWLVDDPDILSIRPGSLLELGCGNGNFLRKAHAAGIRVFGCDWSLSASLVELLRSNPDIRYFKIDIAKDPLPSGFDLVCSGDFLEHLPPDALPETLKRIDGCGHRAYHRIACYDDGHSHLSIFSGDEWLTRFSAIDPRYRILSRETRNVKGEVVVIGK